jgi:carbonic anhydrase
LELSRRSVVGGLAIATLGATSPSWAQDACVVFKKDRQTAITPEAAVQLLKDGNARFFAGKTVNCDLLAQVRTTASGQAPFAAVVGCIDSRVPPELIFDQRIGDIFVARIAGNFVNQGIIGSLEFATKLAGAKAIIVLGHTDCGAIKGSIDRVKLGNLTAMLKNFDPAIAASKAVQGERSSKNAKLVQAVADSNVKLAVGMLVDKSGVLRQLVQKKELAILAAMHDIGTGEVTFFP